MNLTSPLPPSSSSRKALNLVGEVAGGCWAAGIVLMIVPKALEKVFVIDAQITNALSLIGAFLCAFAALSIGLVVARHCSVPVAQFTLRAVRVVRRMTQLVFRRIRQRHGVVTAAATSDSTTVA